jgi:hypothetical protein
MSERLLALIEQARGTRMTPEQLQEQEIGFAFGNVHYENPRVTREMVARSLPSSRDNAAHRSEPSS